MAAWLATTPVVALEKQYPECSNKALLRVWVPSEHVGLVIGKNGATVNALKAKTGVNVQVVFAGTDEGSVAGGSADDVSLWTPLACAGTPHGLQTAWREIMALIEVGARFRMHARTHALSPPKHTCTYGSRSMTRQCEALFKSIAQLLRSRSTSCSVHTCRVAPAILVA
jgi:hypothetical protein